jgi:NADPH-dependent 2,4-dienoyl-CoA reductase/sulfur reductase-like enzyme
MTVAVTATTTEHVDLLIIGAGPAGMAAALATAPRGLSIVLLDDNPLPGGQIWRDGPHAQVPKQARDMRSQLKGMSNVRLYSGCKVVALAGPKRLLLEDAERGWVLSYDTLILCTGARERLLPFPGWMLTDERIVIAGTGPLLLASSATAQKHGAEVVRIAEQAPLSAVAGFAAGLWRWPNKAIQAITLASAAYRTSAHVLAALGTDRLEGVRIQVGDTVEELACERLACGFSLVPNTEIGQALGCTVRSQAIVVDDWQASSLADHFAAGECTGFGGSELALVEGRIAGLVAVGEREKARGLWAERQRWQGFADRLNTAFRLNPALKHLAMPETIVCRCEDVRYADLAGHGSWTGAKLATRCGMGACQGRICATAAQTLFGWEPPLLRPPFSPARISTLACLDDGEPVV